MDDTTPTFAGVTVLKYEQEEYIALTVMFINTQKITSFIPIEEEQNIFVISLSEQVRLYQFNTIDAGNFLVKDIIVQVNEDSLTFFNTIVQ